MIENNNWSSTQSGFKPIDSCFNQLISVTQSFNAFDAKASLQVCDVFLNLSRALVRVWHEVLQYKLKNSEINDNLPNLVDSFLHNKCQRIVGSGQIWNS